MAKGRRQEGRQRERGGGNPGISVTICVDHGHLRRGLLWSCCIYSANFSSIFRLRIGFWMSMLLLLFFTGYQARAKRDDCLCSATSDAC